MRIATRIASIIALSVLAGSACLQRTAAPEIEDCAREWNNAVLRGDLQPFLVPSEIFVSSVGAYEWNGGYPGCWVVAVENEVTCESFQGDFSSDPSWRPNQVEPCVDELFGQGSVSYQTTEHVLIDLHSSG